MTTLSQDLLLTLHDSDALRTLFQHLGYTPSIKRAIRLKPSTGWIMSRPICGDGRLKS